MMPVPFKNTAQGNRVYLEGALYFVLKGRVQCLGGRGLKKFSRVTHSAKLLDPPLERAAPVAISTALSINELKKEIKSWNGADCTRRLCRTYIPQFGFL